MSRFLVETKVAASWAFPLLLLLPVALAILPFIGYGRTQRLQAFVRDPRLTALGWFFLLYGASAIVQSGGGFVVFYSGGPGGPDDGTLTLPFNATGDGDQAFGVAYGSGDRAFVVAPGDGNEAAGNGTGNWTEGPRIDRQVFRAGPALWPFWLHHALVIAALLVVAVAYVRPSAPTLQTGMLAAVPFFVVGNAMLQTVEAVLALVPFVMTLLNWRQRRTAGSLQVALGFLLIALAHLAFVPLVLTQPPLLVPLFDILALAGIATLVFAVPRGP